MSWRPAARPIGLLLVSLLVSPLLAEDDDPHAVPRWDEARRTVAFATWLVGGTVEPWWQEDGTSFLFLDDDGQVFRVDPSAAEGERVKTVDDPPATGPETSEPEPRIIRQAVAAGVDPIREVHAPDGRFALSELGPQLALRTLADDRIRALTENGTDDYPWSVGQASFSPSGSWAIVRRIDRRQVHQEPLVHWLSIPTQVSWIPRHRTGQKMPCTELHLLDVRAERLVPIDLRRDANDLSGDDPVRDSPCDQHITDHGWSQDGSRYRFFQIDRTFSRLRLREASLDGNVRTLIDETTDTFIGALRFWAQDAEQTATFLEEGPLAGHFLWISEQAWSSSEGFRTLTLHAPDGERVRRLSSGEHEVQEVVAVTDEQVFYRVNSDPEHPYDTHLHRVGLDGSDPRRLTEGRGEHEIVFSPSREVFVDTWSRPDKPPVVELRTKGGELLEVLSEGRMEMPDDLRWVPPEPVSALAADGETTLYGWLYKPHDFDPSLRYPVVDYIYNGPFTTWAPQTFLDYRGWPARQLAELGFVVLLMDGRGTPERGKAFQDVVYRAFGQNEIPDHAAFLRAIARERPWLDLDRVGLTGGSWGGYMTVRGMLLEPDLYKVGVASNPVYDLDDHNGQSIEGYMGLPQDEPDTYAAASNVVLADRLRGDLLLIHGTIDANALFSATMKMVHALIQADRAFDLLVVPEQSHAFDRDARLYAHKARARHLVEHLGAARP